MTKTVYNGNLWKYLIWVAAILIAIGVYKAVIESNCERIDKVELRAAQNERDIIGMKRDIAYIKEGVIRIENKME